MKETRIMGILNITPDSFYDGNQFFENGRLNIGKIDNVVRHVEGMIADGADIIDIGGESTRPGSKPISLNEELRRVAPIVNRLVIEVPDILVSIDTKKLEVARSCLLLGARMINDVSGLKDPQMRDVAVKYNAQVVIMHKKGTPKTMQNSPVYKRGVVAEIKQFFERRINLARKSGICDENIILDPGIGFGKTLEHNLEILKGLHEFVSLGFPILVGPSRKSFIGEITGLLVEQRLEGTLAAVTYSSMQGAEIVRVHDVKECKSALEVLYAIRSV